MPTAMSRGSKQKGKRKARKAVKICARIFKKTVEGVIGEQCRNKVPKDQRYCDRCRSRVVLENKRAVGAPVRGRLPSYEVSRAQQEAMAPVLRRNTDGEVDGTR